MKLQTTILENQQKKINNFKELINVLEDTTYYNFVSKKTLIENLSYYYGTKEKKPTFQIHEKNLQKLANKIGETIK